jgi:hypothetical protein
MLFWGPAAGASCLDRLAAIGDHMIRIVADRTRGKQRKLHRIAAKWS